MSPPEITFHDAFHHCWLAHEDRGSLLSLWICQKWQNKSRKVVSGGDIYLSPTETTFFHASQLCWLADKDRGRLFCLSLRTSQQWQNTWRKVVFKRRHWCMHVSSLIYKEELSFGVRLIFAFKIINVVTKYQGVLGWRTRVQTRVARRSWSSAFIKRRVLYNWSTAAYKQPRACRDKGRCKTNIPINQGTGMHRILGLTAFSQWLEKFPVEEWTGMQPVMEIGSGWDWLQLLTLEPDHPQGNVGSSLWPGECPGGASYSSLYWRPTTW